MPVKRTRTIRDRTRTDACPRTIYMVEAQFAHAHESSFTSCSGRERAARPLARADERGGSGCAGGWGVRAEEEGAK